MLNNFNTKTLRLLLKRNDYERKLSPEEAEDINYDLQMMIRCFNKDKDCDDQYLIESIMDRLLRLLSYYADICIKYENWEDD